MSDSSHPAPISKHRLQEARRLGLTPRSSELTAGVVLLTAAWVGYTCFSQLVLALQELVTSGFQGTGLSLENMATELRPAVIRVGQEILRMGSACWTAAILTDMAQVGFVWSPIALLPHEERISPVSGLARLLSWPTLERAVLLSFKVFGGVAVVAVLGDWAWRSITAGHNVDHRESSQLWSRGVQWSCVALACAGLGCLLSGILDAWVRQSRWRLSLEQTEDERRRE